jgi:hypothetical protein
MQVVEGQHIPHIGYLFVAIFLLSFFGELPRTSLLILSLSERPLRRLKVARPQAVVLSGRCRLREHPHARGESLGGTSTTDSPARG